MKYQILTSQEMQEHKVGEAITLTAVLSIMAIALLSVVIYRLFLSSKGSTTLPGGWKFTWN